MRMLSTCIMNSIFSIIVYMLKRKNWKNPYSYVNTEINILKRNIFDNYNALRLMNL
jgi:hypothetical protein